MLGNPEYCVIKFARSLERELATKKEAAEQWLSTAFENGLESIQLKSALDLCLGCLKSHHMTKPGISTLVRKTEDILLNVKAADQNL